MIDYRLKNERIFHEVQDPEVAIILFDVILGYGSHMDPASELVPTMKKARNLAQDREIIFVASVCGTSSDPQNLGEQINCLANAGVLLALSNAQAARFVTKIIHNLGSWKEAN